jgi:uncharacterized protein YoxC
VFGDIVKITPQIDRAALGRMIKDLNTRFMGVAKNFGQGLKNAFKFGGVVSLVSGLLSKLLNPLEKAEELINRVTNKGDDAVTSADEFQSDPGKLLRLEALAAAKGLAPETLRQLLGKFQSKLAEEKDAAAAAITNGTEAPKGRLNNFLGETDIAEGFFKFIQSLQKLEPAQRTVIQNEVFGEKIRGRASELFNATDFEDVLKQLPSVEALSQAAKRAGSLADLRDLLGAKRDAEDFINKTGLVNESQIQALDQGERNKNRADDETLKRFDALKTSSIAIQELTHKFDMFVTDLSTNILPKVVKGVEGVTRLADEFLPSFTQMKESVSEGMDTLVEGLADVTAGVEEFWTTGEEYVGKVGDTVKDAVSGVTGVWAEFKSSRIYRTFGGGD